MKKFFKFICFIIVMVLCFYFFLIKGNLEVHNAKNVPVKEGATLEEIATSLEENGAIDNAKIFVYYVKIKNKYLEKFKNQSLEVSFKEGNYTIKEGDFTDLITQLNSGKNSTSSTQSFTMTEGSSIDDLITELSHNNFGSEKEILEVLQDQIFYNELKSDYIWLPDYNPNKIYQLEGYLHPNTYQISKKSTLKSVIKKMLDETDKIYQDHQLDLQRIGLNFDQMLTLASVVEAESKFTEDRPKVAQVFYNRLKADMKLESDITAGYANQEHKVFMYYSDIKTDSPYNTYVTSGLPLGPINSPSLESITGTLFPEGDNFAALYFYARPSGETFYANTWQEHEQNRLTYESEWKKLENN